MQPRIAALSPPYPPAVTEDLAKLMPPGMEPLTLFRTLAHNPRVLGRFRRGGLLDRGSITLRQREIVILRTTARAGAEYEWGVHVAFFGAAAGFDAEQLQASVYGAPDAPCWAADEVALIRAADELHDGAHVSDGTWQALASFFDEAQRMEILVLCGLYRMVAYVVLGAAIPLEPAAPRFPARR